jgi:hypothetical protein
MVDSRSVILILFFFFDSNSSNRSSNNNDNLPLKLNSVAVKRSRL